MSPMTGEEAAAAADGRNDDADADPGVTMIEATTSGLAGGGEVVKFAPFRSTAEASFWTGLADLKLNTVRLSEGALPARGTYAAASCSVVQVTGGGAGGGDSTSSVAAVPVPPARMRFDHDSVPTASAASAASADGDGGGTATATTTTATNTSTNVRNELVSCPGTVTIVNTVEAFKRLDKRGLLDGTCRPAMLHCCRRPPCDDGMDADHGEGDEEDLSPLTSFACVSYLDLKKHSALYWFAFPALVPKSPVRYSGGGGGVRPLRSVVGGEGCAMLSRAVLRMRLANAGRCGKDLSCPPFFIVVNLLPPRAECDTSVDDAKEDGDGEEVRCLPLSLTNYRALSTTERHSVAFAFLDPSADPANPGWPARNLLAYLALRLNLGGCVRVVAYRPRVLRRLSPDAAAGDDLVGVGGGGGDDPSLLLSVDLDPADYSHSAPPSVVGWEPNPRGRPGPRRIDLSPLLDSTQLAEQSVDLNLRLMKWRLLPELDTDMLAHRTRCLLLGAGTLGCGVARTLLGWGVRNITLVDSGRVSYSNPVRQSLFELSDCTGGDDGGGGGTKREGKYKAVAAADALRRIFPGVNSEGIVLSIPMPGHPVDGSDAELAEARRSVERLDGLVREHDVVFLLTDTRESRWLPTVMAAAHDTPLVNAALGLDSWLVIRHGGRGTTNTGTSGGVGDEGDEGGYDSGNPGQQRRRLGCYFCNDVVAPANSTRERTIDEQCTVTRPGLAPIAASMAVELVVAMLHHPDGHDAEAPGSFPGSSASGSGSAPASASSSPLGSLPHQIRGSIRSFTTVMPTAPAFDCCTACGDKVVGEYVSSGFDLVRRAAGDSAGDGGSGGSAYLEELSGLSEFRRGAEVADVDWDVDEDDVDVDGGDGGNDDW